MADYVSTLRVDTGQHDRALSDASKKVGDYKKETDKASASINGMKDATSRSTRELMKEMSTMENLGRSTSNYKRQLADTTKQISDLTINYRNMSEEQKNGAFGQEVAAKIEELKNKAAEYKDAIGDVSAEIQRLSSDTATWDSMKQGIDVASSSLQAFVSVGVLGEQSTERLVAVIAKLKAIETATNAVIKIGNALQRNSALMLGVTRVQALAAAQAKTLEGNATAVATVKQKAFNVVAKANPYVLLATAVIGVVTALAAFAKKEEEATEAEKLHQEQVDKERAKLDSWTQKVGDTVGGVLSKYHLLQIEWSKLQTTSQKTQWITNNQSAFEQLGLKVNSVTDAENVFVKNTDAVVEALKKRALTAAKQAQLTELYSQLIEAQTRAEAEYSRRQVSAGSRVVGSSHNTASGNEYVDRTGNWVYTAKGAEAANKNIRREVYSTVNSIQGEINNLAKDIAGSISIDSLFTSGKGTGSSTNSTPQAPAMEGSLAEANKMVSDLKNKLENMNPGDSGFNEILSQLEMWKQKQKELNELINGTKDNIKETASETTTLVEGSLAEANKMVSDIRRKLENMSPDSEEFKTTLDSLRFWEKKQEDITKAVRGTKEAVEEINDGPYDELIKNLNKVRFTAHGVVGSFNSIYSSFKNLKKEIEEAGNGWEAFFAVFEAGMSLLDNFTFMIASLTPLIQSLTKAKKEETAEEIAGTAASVAATSAKTAEATANVSAAGTAGAGAAAEAAKSVASVPYVGPILAVAAIASVMAAIVGAISQAQAFADGGIIQGSHSIGDYNLARVNSGEMVLNGTQQAKLFNMINTGGLYGNGESNGSVNFKIRGNDLVGVLNNYNQKLSKR